MGPFQVGPALPVANGVPIGDCVFCTTAPPVNAAASVRSRIFIRRFATSLHVVASGHSL